MEYFLVIKKEWSADTCYYMDEPLKHTSSERRRKMSHAYDSIVGNVQNSQIPEQKVN